MGSGPRAADDWVERVRSASDLVEIVGQTVQLRRVGRNWVGLCPFHAEKSPSFSVSPERQLYHCFSCKAGGDVFKFVQEAEKVDFLEAVEMLSRRAGVPVPERRGERSGGRNALLEALELAAQSYEHWLRDPGRGREARAYLEGRGVSDATVRTFRLGLAPQGWQNLLERLRGKVADDLLLQAGLAAPRDEGRGLYDRFRHRIMIPLVAPGGQVVGFGARALGAETPKYLNSPETAVYRKSAFLYALEQARRALPSAGELIVVEGYFDAMALHQAGIGNVVATSGTALTSEHARALRRLVPRVALTFDGDAAGREATVRSIRELLAEGLEVCVVDLPPDEDPDGLVRRRGAEGWRERRAAAYDPVEFVQRHVQGAAGAGGATPAEARERALAAVVELAGGVADPVKVKLLLQRAAELFGVEESVLSRAAALRRRGQSIERPLRAAVAEQERSEQGLERGLLRALLHAPQSLEAVRHQVGPEDFGDPAARALASWLWAGGDGLPDDEPAASLARELASHGLEVPDWGGTARDAARRMALRRLKKQERELARRLTGAADEEDLRLMREIRVIAQKRRELST
jgi:DNA primase